MSGNNRRIGGINQQFNNCPLSCFNFTFNIQLFMRLRFIYRSSSYIGKKYILKSQLRNKLRKYNENKVNPPHDKMARPRVYAQSKMTIIEIIFSVFKKNNLIFN